MTSKPGQHERRRKGFERTASLLQSRIRKAGESRGFAATRVLTHWHEIAGPDIASLARPVDVKFGRGGFGATLTLLTTGANAPMLEMQKEDLRAKVNAVYGYAAIARIRITQTAATGFAEGRAVFEPAKKPPETRTDPELKARARKSAAPIGDDDLRKALEALGENVLSRHKD